MNKQISTTQRIRTMIDKGHNNKAIIEKLQCKPQAVYNIRYQLNKERGLGSIGSIPKPTTGIGAPPKRMRKVMAGELASMPPTKQAWQYVVTPQGTKSLPKMQITTVKPTLWQRVKEWFRG